MGEDKSAAIRALLASSFWPDGIEVGKRYTVKVRDADGAVCTLAVMVDADGDVWLSICDGSGHLVVDLRFPTSSLGGGENPEIRNAILVLMMAIKMGTEGRKKH